jgi:hypothetical protein
MRGGITTNTISKHTERRHRTNKLASRRSCMSFAYLSVGCNSNLLLSGTMANRHVVGVDVGGTNTDAVIMKGKAILAWHKSPTTADIRSGVSMVIQEALRKACISSDQISAVKIGTTQFLNASLEGDSQKMDRVAVIRLCGPYTRSVAPFRAYTTCRELGQALTPGSQLSEFSATIDRRTPRICRRRKPW